MDTTQGEADFNASGSCDTQLSTEPAFSTIPAPAGRPIFSSRETANCTASGDMSDATTVTFGHSRQVSSRKVPSPQPRSIKTAGGLLASSSHTQGKNFLL